MQVIDYLELGDEHMVAAIIQVAAALDLVDSMHSSMMVSVLKLHTAVYGGLQ